MRNYLHCVVVVVAVVCAQIRDPKGCRETFFQGNARLCCRRPVFRPPLRGLGRAAVGSPQAQLIAPGAATTLFSTGRRCGSDAIRPRQRAPDGPRRNRLRLAVRARALRLLALNGARYRPLVAPRKREGEAKRFRLPLSRQAHQRAARSFPTIVPFPRSRLRRLRDAWREGPVRLGMVWERGNGTMGSWVGTVSYASNYVLLDGDVHHELSSPSSLSERTCSPAVRTLRSQVSS